MSTQNVNVAHFARNVECDFLCDFQTPWSQWGGQVDGCFAHILRFCKSARDALLHVSLDFMLDFIA